MQSIAKFVDCVKGRRAIMLSHAARKQAARVTVLLVLIFFVVGLLISISVYQSAKYDYVKTRQDAGRDADVLSRSFSTHLAQVASRADILTRSIAYEYKKSNGIISLDALASEKLIVPGRDVLIALVDANGVVKESWPDKSLKPVSLKDRQHFIVHQKNPDVGLFVGQPVIGRVSGKWSVQFTRRLSLSDGSFAGVVVVSEAPDFLTKGFVSSASIGANGEVLAFRDDGTLLVRSNAFDETRPTGPMLSAYGLSPGGGVSERLDPVDQQKKLFSGYAVSGYPMVAVVALSTGDIYREFQRRRWIHAAWAGVALVILAFAAVAVVLYGRRLVFDRERAREFAATDTLTDLANRHGLMEVLSPYFDEPSSTPVALMAIDLNDFGMVNDMFGYETGDSLLRLVADRIQRTVGKEGITARIGGDEFIVGLTGAGAWERSHTLLRALLGAFELAFDARGHLMKVRLCIGIAGTGTGACSASTLQRDAHVAVNLAKQAARRSRSNEYVFYTQAMADEQHKAWKLCDDLLKALYQKNLSAEFSSVMSLETGKVSGVVVAPSWFRPGRNAMSGRTFMPVAERNQISSEIWSVVFADALKILASHASRDSGMISIYAMLPSSFLVDSNPSDYINRGAVSENQWRLAFVGLQDLPPDNFVLEKLDRIRKMGVLVYAVARSGNEFSVDMLRNFKIDGVLIDAALTGPLPHDRVSRAMVEGIIKMCVELHLNVLMGEICRDDQIEWLRATSGIECYGALVNARHPVGQVIE